MTRQGTGAQRQGWDSWTALSDRLAYVSARSHIVGTRATNTPRGVSSGVSDNTTSTALVTTIVASGPAVPDAKNALPSSTLTAMPLHLISDPVGLENGSVQSLPAHMSSTPHAPVRSRSTTLSSGSHEPSGALPRKRTAPNSTSM